MVSVIFTEGAGENHLGELEKHTNAEIPPQTNQVQVPRSGVQTFVFFKPTRLSQGGPNGVGTMVLRIFTGYKYGSVDGGYRGQPERTPTLPGHLQEWLYQMQNLSIFASARCFHLDSHLDPSVSRKQSHFKLCSWPEWTIYQLHNRLMACDNVLKIKLQR